MAEIKELLEKRQAQGLLRKLSPVELRGQGKVWIKEKPLVDFCSNDYLGLSEHSGLKAAAIKAISEYGSSSSASRLASGDLVLHHQLEAKIASWKNKPAALVFNSGYQANTGIIPALYSSGDVIFLDRLAHASMVDGVMLSQAKLFRFQHNDPTHLEGLLKKQRGNFKQALIATESIFSMDGDRAPLKELVELKEKYDCRIFLDEAHATGLFGKTGSGLAQELAVEEKIDLLMGTFSKALGSFGAYLAADKDVVDYLVNTCRSFIYSTGLPAPVIAANLAAIEIVKHEPQRRQKVLLNAEYLRKGLKEKGFTVKGESQIVPLISEDNLLTLKLRDKLKKAGFWVLAVRPPTVPPGQARLRFSLNYWHSRQILDNVINAL